MSVRNRQDDKITNDRRARQREVLAALYVSLAQRGREDFTVLDFDEVADLAKSTRSQIGDFVTGFDRCDVIKARMVYARFIRKDGHPIGVSKREVWLHLPEDQALERLEELFDQERRTGENLTLPPSRVGKNRKSVASVVRVVSTPDVQPATITIEPSVIHEEPAKVTVAPDHSTEETRAIAGPEPISAFAVLAPLRKDEYGALVEAARQYANRKKEVEKAISNLRSMGVEINEAILERAVKFPKDQRMEDICEILPYITRLENAVEHLTRQLIDARQRATDYVEIKRERDRMREQLNRKIAENIALQQRG